MKRAYTRLAEKERGGSKRTVVVVVEGLEWSCRDEGDAAEERQECTGVLSEGLPDEQERSGVLDLHSGQ